MEEGKTREILRRLADYGDRGDRLSFGKRVAGENGTQTVYSLVNRLKRQGYVRKKKENGKSRSNWVLTRLGLKKLRLLEDESRVSVGVNPDEFLGDSKPNVIIFDVPERYCDRRRKLRALLISLEYSMIQKSVWFGSRRPSWKFYEKLNELSLTPFVKVLEVSGKLVKKLLNTSAMLFVLIYGLRMVSVMSCEAVS